MKVPANKAEEFIRSPPPNLRVALIYGPDEGLVRERAVMLGSVIVPDLSDPFIVTELSSADLTGDPARLPDEVAAIALTGGRRLIRIRDAVDSIAPSVKTILENETSDTVTVLQAGQLNPRSLLRKLIESHMAGAAIPCYIDDDVSLERVIHQTLTKHNVTISPEASTWLIGRLGSDRAVSRGEAEKLALFGGTGSHLDLQATMACIGDSAADSLDELINAAADGDSNAVDVGILRCFQAGTSAVGILRAMTRHLIRLEAAGIRIKNGENAGAVLKSLRPPIFFKLERRFRNQLSIWHSTALGRALQLTLDAELNCKRAGIPEDPVCGRALLQIASLARQQRRTT